MYSKERLGYLFVAITCGIFQEALALKCYECTESEPFSCGERFNRNNVTITDCQNSIYTIDTTGNGEKKYACLFIRETDATGKSTYTRRCSLKNLNDTCERIKAKNDVALPKLSTTCEQCQRDLCNSSTQTYRYYINVILVFFCCTMFRILN